MGMQRIFSLDGYLKSVSTARALIQHIHGNPLPTIQYSGRQAHARGYIPIKFIETIPPRAQRLIGKNYRADLWSTVTMRQLRNKMLAQSASWLCVGLVHPDHDQRWRKFGNFAHMIGDTFSASHTLRLPQKGHPLVMSYSMDTVMWKRHVIGDETNDDFRFIALTRELKSLMVLYSQAAKKIETYLKSPDYSQRDLLTMLSQLSQPIYDRLCDHTLVMDSDTLNRPAGGSTLAWSAAYNQGKAMLPSGLTSESDLKRYIRKLKRTSPDYFYPERDAPDYCKQRRVLSCSWTVEIKPALTRSVRVHTMFVPQVDRSYPP
jgi:hypothetical protein